MARPSLQNNVKFKALVRRLQLPRPYVRGLLDTMWDVANESGNPVLGCPDDVEAAGEWPGAPGELFGALRDVRLIDDIGDGRWIIHDYWDHAPHYVKNRKAMEARRKGLGALLSGSDLDNRRDKDLRTDCVTQCETVAQMCTTPAPAPKKTPNGVLAAGAAAAPHAPTYAMRTSRDSAGRTKTASKTKKQREEHPEHAVIREHFCTRWRTRHGADYAWNFGKDDALLRRVLDALERDAGEAKAVVDRYLADPDPWLAERAHEIAFLPSRLNRYRVDAAQPEDGRFERVDRTDAEWDAMLLEGHDGGNGG